MVKEKMEPFFIIGSQRSGTTLFRLLLNAHSQVAIPEEGTFWMPLLKTKTLICSDPLKGTKLKKFLTYLKKNSQLVEWNIDHEKILKELFDKKECPLDFLFSSLYHEFARSTGKLYWGDKTPSFFRKIEQLSKIFPKAKFIHIIRDGRDVYLSRRKMAGRKNISVAALEWKHKVLKARKSLAKFPPGQSMEIRFEDVLVSPNEILQKVCSFLGLKYEEEMLNFWKTSHDFIGTHHSDLIFKPISPSSSGKWKSKMSEKEILQFECISGDLLKSLNYEVSSKRVNAFETVKSYLSLIYGFPVRLFEVFRIATMLRICALLGLKTNAAGGK
ncbi:MAG: sulfotransferase [Syntrophotaleaceae bacterium]